jgi:AraC family transcriptional regulator of adaptative response/methylated-DNA-[protein]-cysteine methyltransferase
MRFFATAAAAERAGFRPCKRCKPNRPGPVKQHTQLIHEICRYIAACDEPPTLDTLARHAGLSPHYFHRLFKSVTGITPKAYVSAERGRRLQSQLDAGAGVTDAIYAAGYRSSSRFYSEANRILGMTAKHRQKGGRALEIHFAVGECSLGSILVAQTHIGVCAILLGDDPELLVQDLQRRFPAADLIGGDNEYEQTISQVIGFVENPKRGLNLPLDIRGTAFQQRVWQALQKIPIGETLSYSEIAKRLGMPTSIRAVAGACAANPLAVAIPCHRVVRKSGDLAGYRWGIEKKKLLLDREAKPESR